jgi:hypothetical protein
MTEIPEHLRRRAEDARMKAAESKPLSAADVQGRSLPLHLQEAAMGRGGMLPDDPRPCVIAGGTNIHGLVGPFENQALAHAYYQANQPKDQVYLAPPLLKALLTPTPEALERAREAVLKSEGWESTH